MIVGVVEFERILPKPDIQAGDLLVGLPSSGPHTNGFSLIRQIFKDDNLDTPIPELGCSLADALLVPHRSYLSWMQPVFELDPCPVKALAHLTGGGFIENIPRVLPDGAGAVVHRGSWTIPPLFKLIQSEGNVTWDEMARVFNLGIGMVAVVAPDELVRFQAALPQPGMVIGEIIPGEKKVTLV
jgi:phosphoribosylformylglycinamidine cyclo-ligase